MTRCTLFLALLGLLLCSPSCRHRATPQQPRYSHEEALPVSNLPHDEFSRVSPQRGSRH